MMKNMYSHADRDLTSPNDQMPSARIVQSFPPGASTAAPFNVSYRLGKIKQLGLLKGKWLDYGCAEGGYTSALTEFGANSAIGVDVIEDRITEARRQNGNTAKTEFIYADSDRIPLPDATFDGVLVNEVLEHVTSEASTLSEIFRVLRPGGFLIVMSPNRWFPFEGHGGHIRDLQLPWPVPFLPWLPKNFGQRFMFARNYWPNELRDLIKSEGFTIRALDFVWPVFEVYRWFPASFIKRYQKFIPILEKIPILRRFGVSVFVAAQKPF
jgi:SAM-dependent methyltransferase